MFQGKKTYIVAAAIIASAVGAFFQGQINLGDAVTYVLNGLGFAALRYGVATDSKKEDQ